MGLGTRLAASYDYLVILLMYSPIMPPCALDTPGGLSRLDPPLLAVGEVQGDGVREEQRGNQLHSASGEHAGIVGYCPDHTPCGLGTRLQAL